MDTDVSNTLCELQKYDVLCESHCVANLKCEDAIGSNALCDSSNDKVLSENHCVVEAMCEVIPVHDKSDNNFALLLTLTILERQTNCLILQFQN